MLPVSTGGDVCCVLKRSSDGWMRLPVRSTHQRAVVNILLPQFSDFIPVMRKFRIQCRLCSISAGMRAVVQFTAAVYWGALRPAPAAVPCPYHGFAWIDPPSCQGTSSALFVCLCLRLSMLSDLSADSHSMNTRCCAARESMSTCLRDFRNEFKRQR